MAGTIRVFIDASYAVAVMAVSGILAGFATAGITGDTQRSLQVALAAFALAGAMLTVRLWRATRAAPGVKAILPEPDGDRPTH